MKLKDDLDDTGTHGRTISTVGCDGIFWFHKNWIFLDRWGKSCSVEKKGHSVIAVDCLCVYFMAL